MTVGIGAPPPGLAISINHGMVMVGQRMTYLGLIIDGQWTFEPHFEQLAPMVATAVNALCGLLPNLGGAGLVVRRLYEGVGPVWSKVWSGMGKGAECEPA
jgi:hypothetical protein